MFSSNLLIAETWAQCLQRKTNCCNCTDSKIERISSWGPVVHLSSQFVSVFSFQITLSKIKLTITLDQVYYYCAWLIKRVVKRENVQLAEVCVTRWWIINGTWWYWVVNRWRYLLVLGQYKLVLLGIRCYRVNKGHVCLYILEKVEIWLGVTDASQTDNRI